jgi:hypothetical protein
MKRIALVFFILGLALFSGKTLIAESKAQQAPRRESAIVEFTETVKFHDVLLRGEYVIVHDEERMARGEPCTYIYKSKNGQEGELVTSFHCVHVDRAMAKQFTVKLYTSRTPYGTREVQEFQFANSAAGHRVPTA